MADTALSLAEARALFKVALELENDGDLHTRFQTIAHNAELRLAIRNSTCNRMVSLTASTFSGNFEGPSGYLKEKVYVFRELLRRHLCTTWGLDPKNRPDTVTTLADCISMPVGEPGDEDNYFIQRIAQTKPREPSALQAEADMAQTPYPIPPAKEPIMASTNPTAIVITIKTLINGVDIKDMSDAAIYDTIAQQEAAIADLEKINAKPKKLVAELDKRRAGIAALVEYLDSKE